MAQKNRNKAEPAKNPPLFAQHDLDGQKSPPESHIRTHGDKKLAPIARELEAFTLSALKDAYRALAGHNLKKTPKKEEFTLDIADLILFESQKEFDAWFTPLPDYLKEAIERGSFSDCVDIRPIEKKYRITMVSETREYGYLTAFRLSEGLRLGIFQPVAKSAIQLPPIYRRCFAPWLPKPEGYEIKAVSAPESGAAWSNAESIPDSIPILVEAAGKMLSPSDLYDLPRKGILKAMRKRLASSCGQREFPIASRYGLEPTELILRFVVCLKNAIPKRPTDGEAFIKGLIDDFFAKERPSSGWFRQLDVEYLVLIDHLTRRQGFFPEPTPSGIPARKAFRDTLAQIAGKGEWYDVEGVFRSMSMRQTPFSFLGAYEERAALYLKGTELEVGDLVYQSDYDNAFAPSAPLREPILALPLFRAYCYLMAAFGVVEITEAEPPNRLTQAEKKKPISPYDGARLIRVTPFGLWCLDLSETRPKRAAGVFEAIADKELLLVTFRGVSPERRLFLEAIGERMGSDRFRVSETSFVRDCATIEEIKDRVARFKRLIDENPAPRWEEFFARVAARAIAFQTPESAILFPLPADPAIAKDIIDDGAFRKFILRAEGGHIAIRQKDYRKFQKALAERGFLPPR